MPEPLARRLSRLGSSGYIKVGYQLPGAAPGTALIERLPAPLGAEHDPDGRSPLTWESHGGFEAQGGFEPHGARTDELQ
jgi:hypothetical protein